MNEIRPPEIAQERRSTPRPYQDIPPVRNISGASTDDHLIALWLSGRPKTTTRAYRTDVGKLRDYVRKPLHSITARDLIDWAETLARYKPATQYRRLSAVKSLFSYGLKLGYLSLDPAAALRMPRTADDRASKLISREAVQAILDACTGRDRLICATLYLVGLRESELVGLDRQDTRDTGSGYALTVRGKGEKLRHIALPAALAAELLKAPDGPLFRSCRGRRLDPSAVYRIVTKAARAAGIVATPHTLRHAHASHALDQGCPLHVLKETLGHSSLSTTSVYSHSKPSESSALYVDFD